MSEPDEKLQSRGGDMHARVKPLVWTLGAGGAWDARTAFGTNYSVADSQWTYGPTRVWFWADGGDETAKAAAQADYEARILAALEPAPDLAELVEAAKPFALLDETDDSIGDFCEKHPVEGGYVADLRAALTKLGVR